MTMNKATRVLAGALLATLAGTVQAADAPKFFAGASLIGALDSTKKATHNSSGFNIQGGAEYAIQDNLAFRATLGYNSFSGSQYSRVQEGGAPTDIATGTMSLRSYQGSGDFLFASGVNNLRFVFGLSVNRYEYKLVIPSGALNPMGYQDADGYHDAFKPANSFDQVMGTKLGVRLGMEYRILPNLSASLLLQQTELGSNNNESHKLNITPAWLELGVKYHF